MQLKSKIFKTAYFATMLSFFVLLLCFGLVYGDNDQTCDNLKSKVDVLEAKLEFVMRRLEQLSQTPYHPSKGKICVLYAYFS